ncbi:MAG TPA: SusC/RagA family protein, partial [Dysgonamonadaceae bacterium]|nr:SusC/RagA family protein [Dysgonamonadaceae bacterium]
PELPATLGTDVPKVNNLNMESKGFEFVLSWRDKISDFNYNISFNLADSRQKITKYPNPAKVLGTYYSGAYIGDIWGFETIGIAKTNEEMNDHLASLPNGGQSAIGSGWRVGDIMYKDLDGNGAIDTGEGTADKPGDRKIIGNSTPRYNFGLNLSGEWKGFDLNLFFQGVLKRDYMASGMMFWGADGGKWQSMVYKPHLDYFRDDPNHPLGLNLDAYYPWPNWNDSKNRKTQTRYLQNAAYARLKNVTFGYRLPSHFTQKFSVNNLRLFISGENLLTFTKLSKMFDPEILGLGWGDGKTYPLSKTISFGLSVTL